MFPRDTMENRRTFLPFLRGFIVASKKAVVRSIPNHSKRRPSRPGNRAHDRYLAKKKKKIGRVETNSNNEKQNKTKCKIIIIITIKRRGKKI